MKWLWFIIAFLTIHLPTASASDVDVTMNLSNSELYKPEEVTVFIRLTNITEDYKIESLELLDYLERPIDTFTKMSLDPNESVEWVGTWYITEEQLLAEKVAFACRYSIDNGQERKQKGLRFVKPIKNNAAEHTNSIAISQANKTVAPVLMLPNFGSGYWLADYDSNYVYVDIENFDLEGSVYDNHGNPINNNENLFSIYISGVQQGEATICLDLMREKFSVLHIDLSVYVNESKSIFIQSIEVSNY